MPPGHRYSSEREAISAQAEEVSVVIARYFGSGEELLQGVGAWPCAKFRNEHGLRCNRLTEFAEKLLRKLNLKIFAQVGPRYHQQVHESYSRLPSD